ncbi:hypothetical protein H5410_030713 [Solanum commersonii]|uniref:Uncharacterized protein n=1 Tax=Solanum commersonii TaxID=4109 RepID=A0A9J5YHR1_SOLCO|nr:hypothetical protein H5410_030713 [Solanum commersonii]
MTSWLRSSSCYTNDALQLVCINELLMCSNKLNIYILVIKNSLVPSYPGVVDQCTPGCCDNFLLKLLPPSPFDPMNCFVNFSAWPGARPKPRAKASPRLPKHFPTSRPPPRLVVVKKIARLKLPKSGSPSRAISRPVVKTTARGKAREGAFNL